MISRNMLTIDYSQGIDPWNHGFAGAAPEIRARGAVKASGGLDAFDFDLSL
jgi:hypothetical protein